MPKKTLSQQLLDAHVAHILTRCDKKNLPAEAEQWVDQLLSFSGKLKLSSLVKKKTVADTAVSYASDMEIAPAIPEIVAGIARHIFQHEAHEKTHLSDLVSDHDFQDMLDKFAEMGELRERIIHELIGNPVYAALVSDLLYRGITRYVNDNPLTNRLPGAKSMLKLGKSMMEKAGPNFEAGIRHYIKNNTRSAMAESERFLLAYLSSDELIENATNVWNKLKDEPISRFRDYASEDDVEEIFVIGFEFWRRFRKTDYYANLIRAGVEHFYKVYGRVSLKKLMEEFGITRDIILTEVMRYGPDVVAELNKQGVIEEIARAQLAPFYKSDEVAKLLGE